MSSYVLFLLIALAPLACGQLVLGFCPLLPNYVRNLDFQRYSGTWYVIAQSRHHPMNAINCQRETYYLTSNGMSVYFNTSKNYTELQKYTNGTLKPKSSYKGELSLSLNNFPRRFNFKVLHVNYSQVAVEYTCLPGALNYTASVTVLHRQPVHLRNINSGLQALNLTGIVPNELKIPFAL
ncbi:uncharacterized protein CDAR_321171 [Caerostris darwini]|uniref:Lipocalin/cytosolic fatty-acid binding domain-containing protein n=1 Tax=Caerostris darwini TaxID=1538125 RepID=A0AAV4X0F5_9ARAC|nr:uncharacterized protein CDAR_321171 [Caerostris darwini]